MLYVLFIKSDYLIRLSKCSHVQRTMPVSDITVLWKAYTTEYYVLFHNLACSLFRAQLWFKNTDELIKCLYFTHFTVHTMPNALYVCLIFTTLKSVHWATNHIFSRSQKLKQSINKKRRILQQKRLYKHINTEQKKMEENKELPKQS